MYAHACTMLSLLYINYYTNAHLSQYQEMNILQQMDIDFDFIDNSIL